MLRNVTIGSLSDCFKVLKAEKYRNIVFNVVGMEKGGGTYLDINIHLFGYIDKNSRYL